MKKCKIILFNLILMFMFAISSVTAGDDDFELLVKSKDMDNIQVEVKIEILDKGEDEIINIYSFQVAEGQNFKYQNQWTLPYAITTKSDTETEDEDTQINFIENGDNINFLLKIIDNKIVVKAGIAIIRNLDTEIAENKIPVANNIQYEGVSVHKDSKFLKVFSGEYLNTEKIINFYIKAMNKVP